MTFSPPQLSSPGWRAVWPLLLDSLTKFVQAMHTLWVAQPPCAQRLLDFEVALHQRAGRNLCDVLMGFVLKTALTSPTVEDSALALVQSREGARRQKTQKEVAITLLGGSVIGVNADYYLKRGQPQIPGHLVKSSNGFYPHLEVLGIFQRITPALESTVGRHLARSPQSDCQQILAELGIGLSSKVISRIAYGLAIRSLEFRQHLVTLTEDGVKGTAAKGKRIALCVDGGRVRTRKSLGGRRRRSGHHGYTGEWKEPKFFTIYELDAKGRRDPKGICFYEGTMGDADDCFKLIEAYLCHLGAHLASQVVVIADGGPWIWKRIRSAMEKADIELAKVIEVVDFYHAAQRIHKMANEMPGWSAKKATAWAAKQRYHLRAGRVEVVLADCRAIPRDDSIDKVVDGCIDYLEKHLDRMDYARLARRRIPIGSGAVESGIRRVVNLRLKGNGIFWRIHNAEHVMHLRAHLLAGQWSRLMKIACLPREWWQQVAA